MKVVSFLVLFVLVGLGFAYASTFATGYVMGRLGASHVEVRDAAMVVQVFAVLLAAVPAYLIAYEK